LGVQILLVQEYLTSVSLVDRDGGHVSVSLSFDTLAIDELASGDEISENNTAFHTIIKNNGVDFSLDLKDGVFTFVHVDGLFIVSAVNDQVLVAFLVFDDPFLVLKFELWRFLNLRGVEFLEFGWRIRAW